jgi:cytoskeletal protein CcmA (bactofilin family)
MFNTRKPEPNNNQEQASNVNTQRTIVSAEQKTQPKTIISKGCHIKGDVSGNDDISVFGKIEGTITLKNNSVTIEKSSKINADVFAKIVNVNGNIKGNIEASEKIVITDSGNVTGDMSAPKVILKDGSYFKGNVSMVDTKINTVPQSANTNKDVKTRTNKSV